MNPAAGRRHLAQCNVARMRGPLESELMRGFRERLEPFNALADRSPGFVWRFQTEEGDATGMHAYEDERILFNLSVWESLEALRDYVYQSAHTEAIRRRLEWFEPATEAPYVLWWIQVGTLPTVEEAVARLERLRREGPSPEAFDFRTALAAQTERPARG